MRLIHHYQRQPCKPVVVLGPWSWTSHCLGHCQYSEAQKKRKKGRKDMHEMHMSRSVLGDLRRQESPASATLARPSAFSRMLADLHSQCQPSVPCKA